MIYIAYPSQCPEEVKQVFEGLSEDFEITTPKEREKFSRYEFVKKSRELIKESGVFIAEASYPSSGVELEAAWAHENKISITLFVKRGKDYPNALKNFYLKLINYVNPKDLREKLVEFLNNELPLESKKDYEKYTEEDGK